MAIKAKEVCTHKHTLQTVSLRKYTGEETGGGINISSVLGAAFTVLWIVSVHKCMHPYICGKMLILDHTKDFWLRNTRREPRECAVLDARVGAFSHVYLLVGELSSSPPWETRSPPPTPETHYLLYGPVSEKLPSRSYRSA